MMKGFCYIYNRDFRLHYLGFIGSFLKSLIQNPPSDKNLKGYFKSLDKDFQAWKKRFVIDTKINLEQMPN